MRLFAHSIRKYMAAAIKKNPTNDSTFSNKKIIVVKQYPVYGDIVVNIKFTMVNVHFIYHILQN